MAHLSQFAQPTSSTFQLRNRSPTIGGQIEDNGTAVIRYSLLVFAMIYIVSVAGRDWFRGLCFMLPLLAVLERPDMPREMLGVGGLNPFNILMLIVMIAWFIQRRNDGSHWQANTKITRLFIIYMLILAVSTTRLFLDSDSLRAAYAYANRDVPSAAGLFIDNVVNTAKWLIPGLLIATGANSKERVKLVLVGLLATGALLSLQVIAKMMPGIVSGQDLAERALRVLDRDLGYHRVDLAAITASMAWAFLAARPAFKPGIAGPITIAGFGLCSIAMALTGGRAGMLSWVMCALVLGFLKWRKTLILIPAVSLLALAVVPGLQDRLMQGFSGETGGAQAERRASMGAIDESGRDRYAITSGRVVVWPLVIAEANKRPIIGHGREAMQRRGIVARLKDDLNITTFGHPHNAFLQLYIDTGVIGLFFVGWFFWLLGRRSMKVFASPPNATMGMVASMSLSFLVVNMTASLGSQSFYPKQGATLYWIVICLTMSFLFRKRPVPERQAQPAPYGQLIR